MRDRGPESFTWSLIRIIVTGIYRDNLCNVPMSHEHAEQPEGPDLPKSSFTPDEFRGVAEELSSHFPPPRAGTELVLLEVSPRRVHAYWNIDLEDYRAGRERSGSQQSPLVIRLFDVTDGTPPERAITAFDNEVQGMQGHAYLDLWKDGQKHQADLGFRDPEGRLSKLARSNVVSTASSGESDAYHTQALDTATPENLRVTDLVWDPDMNPENTDADTGAPVTQDAPVVSPAKPAAPDLAAWPSAESLERLVPAGVVAAEEPPDEKAPDDGKPAPLPPPPVAAPSPVSAAPLVSSPMPLDSYVSLSSFEPGRREVALEVNVELHIYGRAKPGTELTLYGQPVPLRPDGTFSIRKPLPQGAVVLPLLAVDPPDAPPGA